MGDNDENPSFNDVMFVNRTKEMITGIYTCLKEVELWMWKKEIYIYIFLS